VLCGFHFGFGLGALSTGLPNELGSLVMQPKTLRVLKQRAEMGTG
jgi:hypothetical protein